MRTTAGELDRQQRREIFAHYAYVVNTSVRQVTLLWPLSGSVT